MKLRGRLPSRPFPVTSRLRRRAVTLLPETRIVEWQGQQVETLVSQYVAYLAAASDAASALRGILDAVKRES
jgi:hypothetical protein